jgi:hypothetical protein
MYATIEESRAAFGGATFPGQEALAQRLTYATYAGDPTNNVTPVFRGQRCFDTSNSDWYTATGTAAANWKKDSA